MIPASLAGIVFLCSLAPGAIFLWITSDHRRGGKRPTAIQEVITFIAVGMAIALPVILVTALIQSDAIADQLQAWGDLETLTAEEVRQGARLVIGVTIASLVVSVATGTSYNCFNTTRSAESTWHTVFWQKYNAPLKNYVQVELRDKRTISGVIHSYDAEPIGQHRDLALQRPIRVVHPSGNQRDLKADRIVIPEDEIVMITVQLKIDPGEQPG